MKLLLTLTKDLMGSEIMTDGKSFTVFNFINLKERTTSLYWTSRTYQRITNAEKYANQFLNQ